MELPLEAPRRGRRRAEAGVGIVSLAPSPPTIGTPRPRETLLARGQEHLQKEPERASLSR